MARSHPPTLFTLTRRALRDELALPRGTCILAAVSGGPDSMALLHALAVVAPECGCRVVAHGVDHGLRAEAASELDLAETLAARLGVLFRRTHVEVARGGNLQARARAARFVALRRAAAEARADVIATGHHAEDRAETVLLRLLRGAGPRGLAVLPPRDGDLVRPLLAARRADIEAHLARHGLPYAADPSNADPRFLRVRVRTEVLPVLQRLSPGVVAHLNALADQLADAPRPELADSQGRAVRLGRAQLEATRRASRRGASVRLLLAGGRGARFDPETGALLFDAPEEIPRDEPPADPGDPPAR